ncbi:MAG: hypothetical protein KDJ50_09545 [Alphaproteobacteria bacterium]|nr:hypothetical protein [Alphaproteobacteria bacterium]
MSMADQEELEGFIQRERKKINAGLSFGLGGLCGVSVSTAVAGFALSIPALYPLAAVFSLVTYQVAPMMLPTKLNVKAFAAGLLSAPTILTGAFLAASEPKQIVSHSSESVREKPVTQSTVLSGILSVLREQNGPIFYR